MKTCETCKHWTSRIPDEEVIITTNKTFACSKWEISEDLKREAEEEIRERTYEKTLEHRQRIQEYLKSKGRI